MALYACEAWLSIKTDEKSQQYLKKKLLKKVFGPENIKETN